MKFEPTNETDYEKRWNSLTGSMRAMIDAAIDDEEETGGETNAPTLARGHSRAGTAHVHRARSDEFTELRAWRREERGLDREPRDGESRDEDGSIRPVPSDVDPEPESDDEPEISDETAADIAEAVKQADRDELTPLDELDEQTDDEADGGGEGERADEQAKFYPIYDPQFSVSEMVMELGMATSQKLKSIELTNDGKIVSVEFYSE